MTRLLCTADLHIGAGSDHRVDALADQEHVLVQIVGHARAADVDTLLLAGDVFHRPKPTPAELHVFSRFARALEEAAIPTVAILGNAGHDQLGADLPSALELFASDWMRVSRVPELVRAAGDVAVCTLPSVPISRLVAMRGGGDRGETIELAAELLIDVARELREQVPEGWPSVLMGHWSVSGAELFSGLPVGQLHDVLLPVEELEALGFDAVVLGHVHKPQLFSVGAAPVFYCGSPMIHNFGEAGDHGVWILDLEGGNQVSPEFVALDDRRFVTVNVDLSSLGSGVTGAQPGGDANLGPAPLRFPTDASQIDPADEITAAISEQLPLADAVVRVSYRATEEQHRRVDHAALTGFLEETGVHKVYGGIHWEPVRETRARVAGVDESLTPLEAVRSWCKANAASDDEGQRLESLTSEYLAAA